MATPVFKRILLKLSGEALMGTQNYGIDTLVAESVAREIRAVHELGVEIAVVVGGGNIFRGVSKSEQLEIHTRVMSAIDIPQLAEPFIRRRAVRHLEKQRVVIFAAGTGNPYFTTDSAAALRALEIEAEVIFKATKVDGIYSADPMEDLSATRFEKISYQEVLEKQLKVMDTSAISLCMDNALPIMVFNMLQSGNITKAVSGDLSIGTLVTLGGTATTAS
jgi:uridylate kinase